MLVLIAVLAASNPISSKISSDQPDTERELEIESENSAQRGPVSFTADITKVIGDDKPVVIAFTSTEQREEYNQADEIRKAEMEQELRVDMFGNNASA